MKTFKEFLLEKLKIITTTSFGEGKLKIPVIIGGKSFGKDILELRTNIDKSTVEDLNSIYSGAFRILYEMKTGKFYTWFSQDAIHDSIRSALNMKETLEMWNGDPPTRNSYAIDDYNLETIGIGILGDKEKRKQFVPDFKKYFGRSIRFNFAGKKLEWL